MEKIELNLTPEQVEQIQDAFRKLREFIEAWVQKILDALERFRERVAEIWRNTKYSGRLARKQKEFWHLWCARRRLVLIE